MRVLSPGAVETIDEYSRSDPTVGREIAIERSMPACWPTVVTRSAGVMRVAISPDPSSRSTTRNHSQTTTVESVSSNAGSWSPARSSSM